MLSTFLVQKDFQDRDRRPQAVAPRPLWRLPPPASVASSPPFFSAPGSGSPSPVEVAPAGLGRVVASFFFSATGSGSPSPVEVAPAGLCRVASVSRQWLPVLRPRAVGVHSSFFFLHRPHSLDQNG